MPQLKGVIFGWDNVLVARGKLATQAAVLRRTGKLVRYLKSRGVEIVVVTNKQYHVYSESNPQDSAPAKKYFEEKWGVTIDWHLCGQNGKAGKQSHAGFQDVLKKRGWEPNNTVYVGNSKTDMMAAVNNKVLLLTAKWFPDTDETTEYGFHFDQPKGVARFVDVFCLRDRYWYYQINDNAVQVYTLAPLNTFHDVNKYHCDDFLANVKNGLANDDEFWAKFLCTSMYFSGVYTSVDLIAAYPKHTAGQYQDILVKPMDTFAKSFGQKRFVRDLIERHSTALKSQFNRDKVDHLTQLDTIRLNPAPTKIVKGRIERFPKYPAESGKTVLVIDDVCTKGMSFEAARVLLNSRGVNVISVAFLKTPRHEYQALGNVTLPNGPFKPNKGIQATRGKTYSYNAQVIDTAAPTELTQRLKRYQEWEWPDETG